MRNVFSVFLFLVVLSIAFRPVQSADDVPSVTVVHAGADVLLKDLEFLASLTTKKEQAEWKKIIDKEEGILEIFLLGIDRAKPIRVDVLLNGADETTRLNFPISSFQEFVEMNLGGFDINVKKLSTNFFQLSGGGFDGYLRYADKYATIAENKKDLPADLPNPANNLEWLTAKKYSVGFTIHNRAEGKEARRKSMQQLRANLTDALKKQKTESEDAFSLRKAAVDSQMDELERFFVDASRITMGMVTDFQKKEARLETTLEALPDTDLQRDIDQIVQHRSYFANIQPSPSAILFGKLNLTLNDMRQTNLRNQFKFARAIAKSKMADSKSRTDAEKAAGQDAIDAFFNLLDDGTQHRLIDGFLEVRQDAKGQRVVLAANRTPDGTQMEHVLESLSKAKAVQSLKLNMDKAGDVSIHSFTPIGDSKGRNEFFGSQKVVVYVGTCADAIWYAAGADALSQLKAVIASVAEKIEKGKPPENGKQKASPDQNTDRTFAELTVTFGPWVQYLDARRKRLDAQEPAKKLTETEKAAKAEGAKLRRLAIEAFQPGDDTMTLQLKRVEHHVDVHIRFEQGLVRLVSKIVADFAEENL